jgi:hypothetical protein
MEQDLGDLVELYNASATEEPEHSVNEKALSFLSIIAGLPVCRIDVRALLAAPNFPGSLLGPAAAAHSCFSAPVATTENQQPILPTIIGFWLINGFLFSVDANSF